MFCPALPPLPARTYPTYPAPMPAVPSLTYPAMDCLPFRAVPCHNLPRPVMLIACPTLSCVALLCVPCLNLPLPTVPCPAYDALPCPSCPALTALQLLPVRPCFPGQQCRTLSGPDARCHDLFFCPCLSAGCLCQKILKQEITGWRLLPFMQFLDRLVNWLRDESILRNPQDANTKSFQDSVPITRKLGERAFKSTLTTGFFQEFKLTSGRRVFVSANPTLRLIITRESAKEQLQKFLKRNWISFDDYAASINSVRIVIADTSFSAFHGFICYCEDFQKSLLCIDVLTVTHITGSYTIPKEFQVHNLLIQVRITCFF